LGLFDIAFTCLDAVKGLSASKNPCQNQGDKTMMRKNVRLCKNCQKPFEPVNWRQVYCKNCRTYKTGIRQPKAKKTKKICEWCRNEFLTFFISHTKFCCHDCREEFYRVSHQIYMTFPFDRDRELQELAKLRELGKNYSLPQRESQ
jgi:hypothetical protein